MIWPSNTIQRLTPEFSRAEHKALNVSEQENDERNAIER
jgi:hypothetical protein